MMDMELKHRLDELETVSQENNEILKGIRRSARIQRVLSIIKWVMIVIFAMAGYYVLQPFVDSARKTYEALQSGVTEAQQVKGNLPNMDLMFQVLRSKKTVEKEVPVVSPDTSTQ